MNMTMFIMLTVTPVMAISSKSWVMLWVTMEISSMSFLMMLILNKKEKNKDNSMKYFIIQTIASSMILMMLFMKNSKSNNNANMMMNYYMMIIAMAFSLKMAMAPLHSWLPKVSKSLNINSLMILLTWQKIIPMWMMINNISMKLVLFISLMSMLMGTLSQMNNMSMKMIMAISSINHMGWMMIISKDNNNITMIYLFIYSIMTLMVMKEMKKNKLDIMNNQMSNKKKEMMILMMSLAGIPPLMGFIPKWITLKEMMEKKSMLILITMIMMATVNFYIYSRINKNNMLNKTNKNSFKKKSSKENNKYAINMVLPGMSIQIMK